MGRRFVVLRGKVTRSKPVPPEGRHQSVFNSTPQLVKKCNEGAHKMERTEQIYTLNMQLDFSKVKVGTMPTPYSTLLSIS